MFVEYDFWYNWPIRLISLEVHLSLYSSLRYKCSTIQTAFNSSWMNIGSVAKSFLASILDLRSTERLQTLQQLKTYVSIIIHIIISNHRVFLNNGYLRSRHPNSIISFGVEYWICSTITYCNEIKQRCYPAQSVHNGPSSFVSERVLTHDECRRWRCKFMKKSSHGPLY